MKYNILTQMELLNNGESIKTLKTETDEVILDLKITYRSDISFELEIGMIDNYSQRSFYIEKNSAWVEDKTFILDMPSSNGEYVETHYQLKVNNLNYQHHDLIWYIKNNTKIKHNSMRAFNFLRLGVNTTSNNVFQIDEKAKVAFTNNVIDSPSFEISTFFCENKDLVLQFNINLIYLGEYLIDEYNAHLKDEITFAVLAIDDNGIVLFESGESCLVSSTSIGKDGYINVQDLQTDSKRITYILIPYINQPDYEELERYKKIAYNNICYYQYT
ncbi:hypothetical protein [Ruminococcus flavefaciens]|uniref:hypothetical protein n=1 Tax=Ruminococcus flavefaciens TaxID=1265 RepID=UPI0026EBDA34|nr:hypothetical protein [Ruminococcus flavefaciens]